MIVLINNKEIDTNKLELLGHGVDGLVYKCDDLILKINLSNRMTKEKFEDYSIIREQFLEDDIDVEYSKIVLPKDVIYPTKDILVHGVQNSLFGYTETYHKENKEGINNFTIERFINELEDLRSDIHTYLTYNDVGIMDTNHDNLLITNDNRILLIDRDRDITKSSLDVEKKMIANNNYHIHNEKRFSHLINRFLIRETINKLKEHITDGYKLMSIERKEEEKLYRTEDIYEMLDKYKYVSNYIDDTVEKIYRKEKRK